MRRRTTMSRIEGVDPQRTRGYLQKVLEAEF